VRQLGHALGCDELRLVSNANRVVKSAIRQGRVHSDYDQLWIELGAEQQQDGELPGHLRPGVMAVTHTIVLESS
jgi:uncharacterized protein VirK/YbjX